MAEAHVPEAIHEIHTRNTNPLMRVLCARSPPGTAMRCTALHCGQMQVYHEKSPRPRRITKRKRVTLKTTTDRSDQPHWRDAMRA
ncbi:hypothetical protein MRB53_039705 [Persea americana]|nr:hypothetical protein MRB53_039705 [Persea americana]